MDNFCHPNLFRTPIIVLFLILLTSPLFLDCQSNKAFAQTSIVSNNKDVQLHNSSLNRPTVTGGDWTSFTLDNNDSRYQATSSITSSNVAHLTQKWVVSTSGTTSTPVVLNGNVYFADWGGNVYSVNISNGNLNWEKNLGGVGISSSLALANGIVYVGDGQGETNVFALSQSTGNIIWSTTLHSSMNAIWASPIVYNGLVYIGVASAVTSSENNPLNQGEIFALNAQTGTVVWSFKTMIGNAGGSAVWGSVVIDPNLKSIFFGTGNAFNANPRNLYSYSIMSLDATTGSLKWYHQIYHTYATGLDKDFGSTPNLFDFSVNGVTDHAIGLGSKDGIYYILDRTSGALLNKFQVGNWPPAGIIGLAGFYYPSGTVNPEIFIPANYNSSGTNHGIVEAVKPLTHSVSWSFNRSGAIDGSVAVIPGAVLFGDISGNLYALSMGSGQQLFHTTMTSGIFGGITVAEGHVLVPTSFGSGQGVYAFSPN